MSFLAILSFITTFFKAILTGLSLKKEVEDKAESDRQQEAIKRFNDNEKAIADLTRPKP